MDIMRFAFKTLKKLCNTKLVLLVKGGIYWGTHFSIKAKGASVVDVVVEKKVGRYILLLRLLMTTSKL